MNDAESARARDLAIAEGRVNGKHRCPRCGLRSNTAEEATECCKGIGPSAVERIPHSRFE